MKPKNEETVTIEDIKRLGKWMDICREIYIARNVTFSEKNLQKALRKIDVLLGKKNEN